MVDACYNNPPLPGSPYNYSPRSERGSPFLLQPTDRGGTPPQDGDPYSPQRGARLHLFQPRDNINAYDNTHRGEEIGNYRTSRATTTTRRIVVRGRYQPTDTLPRPHYTPAPALRRQDAFKVTPRCPLPEADTQTDLLYRLGILYDDDATTGAAEDTTNVLTSPYT